MYAVYFRRVFHFYASRPARQVHSLYRFNRRGTEYIEHIRRKEKVYLLVAESRKKGGTG